MLVSDINTGNVLVIHRSNKVKSARNCWSIPTGTHEIGETSEHCIVRELHEEFNLKVTNTRIFGQYENIAGDHDQEEQYHWILSVYLVSVGTFNGMWNKEPELHDRFKIVHWKNLFDSNWLENHKFHDSLHIQWKLDPNNWRETLKQML
jgi:ADP-ribose pyrophosphatase YjhB (NUDIX family)